MRNRRKPLTRDDLLHRYATQTGMTYGEAVDVHGETDIEHLRAVVESLEILTIDHMPLDRRPGAYRAFARSQPTTRATGQTR